LQAIKAAPAVASKDTLVLAHQKIEMEIEVPGKGYMCRESWALPLALLRFLFTSILKTQPHPFRPVILGFRTPSPDSLILWLWLSILADRTASPAFRKVWLTLVPLGSTYMHSKSRQLTRVLRPKFQFPNPDSQFPISWVGTVQKGLVLISRLRTRLIAMVTENLGNESYAGRGD